MRRVGEGERLVERGADLGGVVDRPRAFGDGGEQRGLVQFLQEALPPAVVGRPAADDHQGGAVEVRGGYAAHPVGHPWAGGEGRPASPPREFADGFGREDRGLLVADVEQAHRRVSFDRTVVDREDVPAGEREEGVYAVVAGDLHGVVAAVAGEFPGERGGAHGPSRSLVVSLVRAGGAAPPTKLPTSSTSG